MDRVVTDLLTTAQAAKVAGITPAAFRKAASTNPTLREAKTMLDARTPAYPRTAVEAWRASTPRRVAKVAALVLLAVFALSACGASPDAPAATHSAAPSVPAVQVQGQAVEPSATCWTDPTVATVPHWQAQFNALSGDPVRAVKMLDALPDPSEGCGPAEIASLEYAQEVAQSMRERFPDLFS